MKISVQQPQFRLHAKTLRINIPVIQIKDRQTRFAHIGVKLFHIAIAPVAA
ncbi:MAG TPA: hypothetical protein VKR53_21975 [Puia sp.]|nr:hypothetical protein [Puia sp.]